MAILSPICPNSGSYHQPEFPNIEIKIKTFLNFFEDIKSYIYNDKSRIFFLRNPTVFRATGGYGEKGDRGRGRRTDLSISNNPHAPAPLSSSPLNRLLAAVYISLLYLPGSLNCFSHPVLALLIVQSRILSNAS